MRRGLCWALTVVAVSTVSATGALADTVPLGDAEAGEKLFRQCQSCHQIGPNAKNRVGPKLTGIFDRQAGTMDGARYSPAMIAAGQAGLVWDRKGLDAYLADPRGAIPGNRMSFRGVKDPADRAHIIAYLRLFSDNPADIPEAAPTARALPHDLDPRILEVVGDADYGAYLSSECTTCHQVDGDDDGIPSITGWPTDDFVIAMHAYKVGGRTHPVMQMMAGRLSDEEISSLAEYFAGL